MSFLRTIVFKFLFYPLTAVWIAGMGITLLFPGYKTTCKALKTWSRCVLWLLKYIAKINVEFHGLENVPADRPVIICPKHESTIDAFAMFYILNNPSALAKHQLYYIPVMGQLLRKMRIVPVKRWKGTAHRKLPDVIGIIDPDNRPLLVFPEGTRTSPGKPMPLKPGAWYLHEDLGLDVLTSATNVGFFWPPDQFMMRSGTAVIEFHKPLPADLDKDGFMAALKTQIQDRSAELRVMAEEGAK